MESIKQTLLDITKPLVSTLTLDDILEIELTTGGYAYEINGLPSSNITRSTILSQIYTTLIQTISDTTFELKQGNSRTTTKIRFKTNATEDVTFGSKSGLIVGIKNSAKVYVIKTNKKKGAKTHRLTPGNMGLSKGTTPLNLSNYKTVLDYISAVEDKIDELVSEEKIPAIYGEWLRLTVQTYNPAVNASTMSRLQTLWNENPGLSDEINSEVLEIFCPLAYIKSVCGNSTLSSIPRTERQRFYDMIGKNSGFNYSNFRIWFPQGENFPIIDSQVAYIESNDIKVVLPISTKNITRGENTVNTLKFTDMFENGRQVTNWYKKLPDKVKPKQQVQTCVATQSARRKSPTYVIEAMAFILNSALVQQAHKTDLLGLMRNNFNSTGVEYTLTLENIKSLIRKIGPNTTKKTKIDNIVTLSPSDKTLAKLFVVCLIKDSRTYQKVSHLEQDRLVQLGDNAWEQLRLLYPYTFENLCLFFEKILERSTKQEPKYNYQRLVKDNYFSGNKSLITKYGDSIVAGAGEVIIAKTNVHRDGLLRIQYDTSVTKRVREHYGLRSKNSMNRLEDSLGVAP